MASVKLSLKAPATSHRWSNSYIRGYHKYKSAWPSTVVKKMLRLITELTNPQDPLAMTVTKYGCVVGHILRKISPDSLHFPRKEP